MASFMDPWWTERLALESDFRVARRPGSADARLRHSGHSVQELLACQTAPPMSRAGEYRQKRRPASADTHYLHSGAQDILYDAWRPGRRPDSGMFREGSGHRAHELLCHQVQAPTDLPMATRPLRCNGTGRHPSRDSGRRTEELLTHQIEPPGDLQDHQLRAADAKDLDRDSDLAIEELLKCQTAPPSSIPALAKYRWLWPTGRGDFVVGDAARHELSHGGLIPQSAYGCPSFSNHSFGGAGHDALWRRHILQENRRASSPSRLLPHNRSDGVRATAFSNPARRRRVRTQSQVGIKDAELPTTTLATTKRVPWQSTERRLGCSAGCRRPCSPPPRCRGQRCAGLGPIWRLPYSPLRSTIN